MAFPQHNPLKKKKKKRPRDYDLRCMVTSRELEKDGSISILSVGKSSLFIKGTLINHNIMR